MAQNCPYANNTNLKEMPCNFQVHPDPAKQHIHYCVVCGNTRDLNKIPEESKKKEKPLIAVLALVGAIALLVIAVTSNSVTQLTPSSPKSSPTYQK